MIPINKNIAIEVQIKLLTFDFIKNLSQGKIEHAFAREQVEKLAQEK